MKFIVLFLLLSLTFNSTIFLPKDKNKDHSILNLMMLGDNGQIDYFESRAMLKPEEKPIIDKWYEDNLLAEKYTNTDGKCIVEDKNGLHDLTQSEGLTNFDNFYKNKDFKKLLNESKRIVFLGDMVYPETKYLGHGGIITDYELPYQKKWKERLICAWNVFYSSMKKMDLSYLEDKNIKIKSKVDFIAGNHSFDIDIHVEENQVKHVKTYGDSKAKSIDKKNISDNVDERKIMAFGNDEETNRSFLVFPKIITIKYENFIVKFIDFNSGLLLCAQYDKKNYDKCIKGSFLPSSVEYSKAKKYFSKLIYGIRTEFVVKKGEENHKIWNVMRAHHPPSNPEDGDESFYFTETELETFIFSKNMIKIKEKIILFNEMKKHNVNIFLGSHVHNAQVLALPYNTKIKMKHDLLENKDCLVKRNIYKNHWGCYESENFNEYAIYKDEKSCNPIFLKELNFKAGNNDVLYIFITGNSGRKYDSVKPQSLTNGYLIWSRAITNTQKTKYNYGFSYAKFSKDQVEISFYELDMRTKAEGELINVSTFVIKEGESSNFKETELKESHPLCKNESPKKRKLF